MQYYLVFWHQEEGRLNGWDLVYAKDKRAARTKYKEEHYSPIDKVMSKRDPDGKEMFEGITPEEFERARRGEVVNIEAGT